MNSICIRITFRGEKQKPKPTRGDFNCAGEPVRNGERGGHAEPGPGDAAGPAPAQDVPAQEAGEENGRGRLAPVLPPHHGGHL